MTSRKRSSSRRRGTDYDTACCYLHHHGKPGGPRRIRPQNGNGDGNYKKNEVVTITADEPEDGKMFIGWTSDDGIVFDDESASTTTFKMPAKPVTVKANYGDIPKYDKYFNSNI